MAAEGAFAVAEDQFGDNGEGLDEDWKRLAYELVGEKEEEYGTKLSELRSALVKSKALQEVAPAGETEKNDQYYVRFLRACNWSVPNTVEMLTSFYKMLRKYPQYTLDLTASQLDHVWKAQMNGSILKRDQHGRRFYFYRVHKWDVDVVPITDLFIAKLLIFDMLTQEPKTQVAGITLVYDVKGFEAQHLRKFGLAEVRFFAEFLSGSFPVWIRQIHIVNNPKILDVLYNLILPFLGKRIRNNIIFHGSNLEKLHAVVPKETLPTDLGGTEGEFDNSECVKAILDREVEFCNFRNSFE